MIYRSGALTVKFIVSGPLQNQARTAFYWHGNYKGSTPPEFFANGKFYAINPQMIPDIHGRPEIPSTSPSVPPPPSVTTSASKTSRLKAQQGLFLPSDRWYNIRG